MLSLLRQSVRAGLAQRAAASRMVHSSVASMRDTGDPRRQDLGGFIEWMPDPNDRQIGTYTEVPFVSAQLKQPHLYESKQHRRNLDDPLHEEDDILSMWVTDQNQPRPTSEMLLMLGLAFGSLYGVYLFCEYTTEGPERRGAVPKEFPYVSEKPTHV